MTRFPWETGSAHRGHDDDGSESLHTDVMRFMAIIALCLVAIFALVRSLPLNRVSAVPTADPPPTPPAQAEPIHPAAPQPVGDTLRPRAEPILLPRPILEPRDESATDPQPAPLPEHELKADLEPTPVPEPAQEIEPAASASSAAPPREGFSLRFASDEALQVMVADGRVRVYARTTDGRWWRSQRSRAAYFRPGAAPTQLHEMSVDTVPAAMLAALGRDAGPGIEAGLARWGVSLPPEVEARIASIVEGSRPGLLVIAASGRVTLHPFDEGASDG